MWIGGAGSDDEEDENDEYYTDTFDDVDAATNAALAESLREMDAESTAAAAPPVQAPTASTAADPVAQPIHRAAADPAAPPLHDTSATLAAAVAPEPAAQPVQSALATPAAAAAGPQLEPPTVDDEEPKVGSKVWWEKSGLVVKCLKPTDEPFKTKSQSRQDAQKANLRSESTGLEGWNVSRVDALLAYWHTNDKTRYTTRVIPLRAKLELDAPKRKSTRRGFSHPSTEKNHAKAKLEQTGNQAPDYYQRPEVIAARSERERRMLFLQAKVGRRVGGATWARSEYYTPEFIGELYALQYIGLFNPHIRPLICCCELEALSKKYGIEIEWERRRTASKSLTFFRIYDSVIPRRSLYLFQYRFTGFP